MNHWAICLLCLVNAILFTLRFKLLCIEIICLIHNCIFINWLMPRPKG
jgi:hypothetical protein